MRILEKMKYKNCRLEILPHVARRAIERNFPLHKIRNMIFNAKWMPHPDPARRTCVYKDDFDSSHWTIIIAPYNTVIFIITLYESKFSEIKEFKSFKEERVDS